MKIVTPDELFAGEKKFTNTLHEYELNLAHYMKKVSKEDKCTYIMAITKNYSVFIIELLQNPLWKTKSQKEAYISISFKARFRLISRFE